MRPVSRGREGGRGGVGNSRERRGERERRVRKRGKRTGWEGPLEEGGRRERERGETN